MISKQTFTLWHSPVCFTLTNFSPFLLAENKNGERANIPQSLTARIIHVAISRVLYHKCCDRYYLNTCYGYYLNGWPKNEYKKTGWGYYETGSIVEEMEICKNHKIRIIFWNIDTSSTQFLYIKWLQKAAT